MARTTSSERTWKNRYQIFKISYNKVFGYFIEITRANLQGFEPSEHGYHRKQTLSNAERFITDELKEKEDIILGCRR